MLGRPSRGAVSGEQGERYARHLTLPEVGPEGQRAPSGLAVPSAGIAAQGADVAPVLESKLVRTLDRVVVASASGHLDRHPIRLDDARKRRVARNVRETDTDCDVDVREQQGPGRE